MATRLEFRRVLFRSNHSKRSSMSTQSKDTRTNKVTTQTIVEMKARGEKTSMLTAYDYTMAGIIDQAGTDVILVGDSAGNVMAGYETTVPMTLDHMIYHTASVVRAVERALIIADLRSEEHTSELQSRGHL